MGSCSRHETILRVHSWISLPCDDCIGQFSVLMNILGDCSFDLEFTVNSEYVAVSNGKLLHQVNFLWFQKVLLSVLPATPRKSS